MHDKKFKDLTGKNIADWIVLDKHHRNNGEWMWKCRCVCGKEKIVNGKNIYLGKSKSCGCKRKNTLTHGMTNTAPYRAYRNMLNRCYNKKSQMYYCYGARGITVCDEWRTGFDSFWNDMKSTYKERLTLDRVDVNKNYCKSNCRWATTLEQANNTTMNKIITFKGIKDTLPNWARIVGINPNTLRSRIYLYKWNIDVALSTPSSNLNKRKSFRTNNPNYKIL